MLETLLALKNNDVRKIPGYDPEPVERLRKLQRGLVSPPLLLPGTAPPPPWGARPSSSLETSSSSLGSTPLLPGSTPPWEPPSSLRSPPPSAYAPWLHYPVRLPQQTEATGQVPVQSPGSPDGGICRFLWTPLC